MGKQTGPKRNAYLQKQVVYLRNKGDEEYPFSRIGRMLGFSRQRAHAIYSRWKREVEDVDGSLC